MSPETADRVFRDTDADFDAVFDETSLPFFKAVSISLFGRIFKSAPASHFERIPNSAFGIFGFFGTFLSDSSMFFSEVLSAVLAEVFANVFPDVFDAVFAAVFFAAFSTVFSFAVLMDDFAIMEESFSKKVDEKPKVYGSIGKYSNETTIRDPDPRYLGIADFLGLEVAPRTVTVRQREDFRQCAMTAGWLPVMLSRSPIS